MEGLNRVNMDCPACARLECMFWRWLRTEPAICPRREGGGRCELPVQLLWRPRVTYNS